MTDRFDSTDNIYAPLAERIARNITSLPERSWDEKQSLEKSIKADIAEAESLVQQMELEVRSLPSSHRQVLSKRCQTYRQDIKNMKDDLRRGMVAADESRSRQELLQGKGGAGTYDRAAVLSSTEQLKSQGSRIKNAQAVAASVEMVGVDIVNELDSQGDKIRHMREGLGNVNMALTKSKRIVGGMMRRAKVNRVLMYVIIISLVIMISVIVYYKWIK